MPNGDLDRRTLLLGAGGALAAAALGGPAPAAAARRFDPALARRLEGVLDDAVSGSAPHSPGAILHVHGPKLGSWTGVAGLGRIDPRERMHGADRFRAGSIAKPFVAVTVLRLAERGSLSLDARLPTVLPASIAGRFQNSGDITVRMLLGHRSGIPEWGSPELDAQIARDRTKVWKVTELLDLAAAKPPVFAPGTSYAYSNTDYNLLGLIIERLTGHSWRREVTRRVIAPLGLGRTYLPAPGNRSVKGANAHGYRRSDGGLLDLTRLDPSIAGAAGGGALIATVQDLARFLDALLKGRLFRRRATLRQMLTFGAATGEGGVTGYGLGLERRSFPGDVEAIGHLGGTAGYFSFMARLRPHGVTIVSLSNSDDDPTPLLVPAVQAIASARS